MSGLQLSPIVAGTSNLHRWSLGTPGLVRWIEQALDLGITSFDHADIYGGYTVEALFGQALAAAPGLRQPLQVKALADGSLEQCADLGLRPMLWSPLAGGRLLTGDGDQERRVRAVLEPMADNYSVTTAALVFAWLLRHPSRPWPITGSGRLQGLREAVAAVTVQMSAEDWYRVWQASIGAEVP